MTPKKHTAESGQRSAASILAAADELLAEVGFDGMSMRSVAERAGVNKALVFYHYKNKATLFERVLERYYGEHLDVVKSAFDAGAGDYGASLHLLVNAYFEFIEANRRYPRLIQQQVAAGGTTNLIQRNLRPLFEWATDALSELAPSVGPRAAKHLYVSFSGMVINYFTYAPVLAEMWGGDPLSPAGIAERRQHVHWMVDLVLAGLRAEAANPEAQDLALEAREN